jgi:hypothetical protein
MIHVRAWSDNTSAVTWANRLHSDNPFAQERFCAFGLYEVNQRFRVSEGHLPGTCNVLADAGSRPNSARLARLWTNKTGAWSQTPTPARFRKIYRSFSASFNPEYWPTRATARTWLPGDNGTHGAALKASLPGSPATDLATQVSSSDLQSSVGAHQPPPGATRPAPFCPRLSILVGFINGSAAFPSDSTRDTNWPCAGCPRCLSNHAHIDGLSRCSLSRKKGRSEGYRGDADSRKIWATQAMPNPSLLVAGSHCQISSSSSRRITLHHVHQHTPDFS